MTFRPPRRQPATQANPYDVREYARPAEWTEDSACYVDDETFFADRNRKAAARAKAICSGCDVRLKCLRDALARDEEWGIWGGVNFAANEHRKIGRA